MKNLESIVMRLLVGVMLLFLCVAVLIHKVEKLDQKINHLEMVDVVIPDG